MVYLFIGDDLAAKEIQLKKIKQEFLSPALADFNLDTLYAKEITLKDIQERFCCLPLKNAKRITVIKNAQLLDKAAQEFLLAFSKSARKDLVLVLDFTSVDGQDSFVKAISPASTVMRFKENVTFDAFALNRQIQRRQTDLALRSLNQLLKNGEAPERILGLLRYAWEKQNLPTVSAGKKLKLLLNCDLEIKTGRLKPACALEKLVVSLCALA